MASCVCQKRVHTQAMSPSLGGKLYTSAWIQRSAEYKALCMQAYSLATINLEQIVEERKLNKNERAFAVITDIDETILDNSPNSVHQALRNEDYTESAWNEWCKLARADTLAGAKAFFLRAAQLGATVFYVSNRSEAEREATLQNLKSYGFPFVQNENLLLRTLSSDKEARREKIRKDYDIVMLLGDNLGDFDSAFDSGNEEERNAALARFAQDFGKCFIVLPNPNYGTWEKAMNGGSYGRTASDSVLTKALINY